MDDARRRRFRTWFQARYGLEEGARERFMQDSAAGGAYKPLSKGRVSQLFDESEPFGERAARALADRFGLDREFFLKDDQPGIAELSPLEQHVLALLRVIARQNPARLAELHSQLAEEAAAGRPSPIRHHGQTEPLPKSDAGSFMKRYRPAHVERPRGAAKKQAKRG